MVVFISECGCSPVWSCHRNNPVEEGGGDPEGEIYSTLLNVTWYHYLSVSLSSHLLHFCPVQTGHSNCWRRGVEGKKEACVWFAVQVHPLPTPCLCFNVKGFFLDAALMKLNYPNSLKAHYTDFFSDMGEISYTQKCDFCVITSSNKRKLLLDIIT